MFDACLAVLSIGDNAHLTTQKRSCVQPKLMYRHTQQSDGHLFGGREQHVEFFGLGFAGQFVGKCRQAIGFAAHCRHHNDHVMPVATKPCHTLGNRFYALGRPHRGAAVFLDVQTHVSRP